MVSVLPPPGSSAATAVASAAVYGFDPNPNPSGFYPNYHVPRLSASKSIHLRSQSMPEAVYVAQQQQQHQPPPQPIHAPVAFKPARVRHPSGYASGHQAPQPVMVSLRRSHTNVADFSARKASYGRPNRYWNHEGCELPSGGLYLARSRSNIAALGLNPEAVYRPSQLHHLPKSGSGISRASSFYHHRDHALPSARSLGFLASSNSRSSLALPASNSSTQSCKDLSQPLHVDCSVEYDLGNQPKIPKDSAPLLIIHPAYQQNRKQQEQQQNSNQGPASRFHPYNSTSMSSSPLMSEAKGPGGGAGSSSGHGTSVSSSSGLSSNSSSPQNNNLQRLNPGQRYPNTHASGIHPARRGIARHSSFLVTSPPRMVALTSTPNPHMMLMPTPMNRQRSSIALENRSLFHLSMPDIKAHPDNSNDYHKQGHKLTASQPSKDAHRQWTHNERAQHRHHAAERLLQQKNQAQGVSKARLNLGAKLEAVRKLSSTASDSTQSSSHCDSGLGTPISFLDEVSSLTTSSQNSSHLSKWRSSMSGKTLIRIIFC